MEAKHMIYTIENDKLKVQINSMGAELWSLVNKRDETEHLWQGDKSVWAGRAPTLFPHCGKLKDDRYIVGGETYKSPSHGFAKDYEHKAVKKSKESIDFLLTENEETLKFYPYKFRLYTRFRLLDNLLEHSYEVKNPNAYSMFFSIGYHTGYRIPFDSKHTADDYSLIFEKEETPVRILNNNSGLLSGEGSVYFENRKVIPVNERLFSSVIALTNLKSDYVSLVENDSGRSIKVKIGGFPNVAFWSAPGKVRFICIEPRYGLPDAWDSDGHIENKKGIQRLAPNEGFRCKMTIEAGEYGSGIT